MWYVTVMTFVTEWIFIRTAGFMSGVERNFSSLHQSPQIISTKYYDMSVIWSLFEGRYVNLEMLCSQLANNVMLFFLFEQFLTVAWFFDHKKIIHIVY